MKKKLCICVIGVLALPIASGQMPDAQLKFDETSVINTNGGSGS